MHFLPNSSLSRKNNARNINYMSVLVFREDSIVNKIAILGQSADDYI